jgi:hypothetical protein
VRQLFSVQDAKIGAGQVFLVFPAIKQVFLRLLPQKQVRMGPKISLPEHVPPNF